MRWFMKHVERCFHVTTLTRATVSRVGLGNPVTTLSRGMGLTWRASLGNATHAASPFSYGEDRWIGIGLLMNIVAVTIYLEWEDEETIRIISARKATRHESKEYHKRITH
ncbi:MAG: BrnT family toxin [Verrucomicrobiota bacterium]